jgi:hypothetical protein
VSAVAVGAVVRADYMAFARVLAASLRRHHPDVPFHVLLADEAGDRFDPAAEPFEVTELAALGLPGHRARVFRDDPSQVVLAAKADLLAHLLESGHGSALALDADILVLKGIGGLLAHVARHAVTLTPHRRSASAGAEDDLRLLVSGTYNGGVVGVSRRPGGPEFLAWWRERLREHCRYSPEEGMHYDQRWLDLAPTLFEDVAAVREPGYNVAYWNVQERPRRACRMFHFSGWRPEGPWPVTRWRPELPLEAMGRYAPLFERYAREVEAAGHAQSRRWEYAYGRFADGVAIPPLARELHRELGEGAARFGDPFGVHPGSFREWLDAPAGEGPVTRLWHEVWRRRADLRVTFPDPLGADAEALLRWAEKDGTREHAADARLVPGAAPGEPAPVVNLGGR